MISNAQARVWQLAIATAYAAANHMLFCQPTSKIREGSGNKDYNTFMRTSKT
jgi:hypothetical protein